jgi:hypothetical protein
VTTRDFLNHRRKTSEVEITDLWVVGSFARGAPTCGDLDLVVGMKSDKGLPRTSAVIAAAFGRLQDVRCYQGTPEENSSGVEFSEAVHIWSHGRDWRAAIGGIKETADAGHFQRATDALPLRAEQVYATKDHLEEVVALRDSGILVWQFLPIEERQGVEPRGDSEEAIVRVSRRWGAKSRQVVPNVIEYLRARPIAHIRYTIDRSELNCSGVHVSVGRPSVSTSLLEHITHARLALVPHLSRRGPNGIWEIRRGKEHPLELLVGPLKLFVLVDPRGSVVHYFHECGLWSESLVLPLFRDEQAAEREARLYEDEDGRPTPRCVSGSEILDLASCADNLELFEGDGTCEVIALTHGGARTVDALEQDGSDEVQTEKSSPSSTREVVTRMYKLLGLGMPAEGLTVPDR